MTDITAETPDDRRDQQSAATDFDLIAERVLA
jgi:hypothetical protein